MGLLGRPEDAISPEEFYAFRRKESGVWELRPLAEGDELHLPSLDLVAPVDALYEAIPFEPPAPPAEPPPEP